METTGMGIIGRPGVTRTTAAADPTATVMGTAMETTAMRRIRTVVGRTTTGVAVAVMGMGTEAKAPVREIQASDSRRPPTDL